MKSEKKIYRVVGMSCAACATSVESTLKSNLGVVDAGVNLINSTVWVEFDIQKSNPTSLQKSIRSAGYDLIIDEESTPETLEKGKMLESQKLLRRTIASAIFTLPVFILGMFFMHWEYSSYLSLILSTPILFWFGRYFYINAWKQLMHLKANMDTLVALSTLTAYVFSVVNTFYPEIWTSRGIAAHVYFESAAVIITFILLGKWLEERAKSSTSSSIKKLMGLQPNMVTIVENNELREIPIEQVEKGQIVLVNPGNRIPVDGVVVEGNSWIDESSITGEPLPTEKKAGDTVYSGTSNEKGSLKVKAEKVGSETILSQIVKVVQDAQNSKAPIQKLADKIAGKFVPIVLLIALFSLAIWIIFGGEKGVVHGILAFVTVLAIACPCALGLATPTAITVGIGRASNYNILIKDSQSLEIAHKITYVVFDKTGTITEGKPLVSNTIWDVAGSEKDLLIDIIYTIESQSQHPIASAIASYLFGKGAKLIDIPTAKTEPGLGVYATYNGVTYYIGNELFMENTGAMLPGDIEFELPVWQAEGRTPVFISNGEKVLAAMSVSDKVKASSAEAISLLKSMNIQTAIYTGDNAMATQRVCDEVGITNFKAALLPTQKTAALEQLQNEGHIVAMVGDGINDSQALAKANVSIAMGKGSDIAMDVAGITLISSDLTLVAKTINLSKKTIIVVKQNLFWAFFYNILGIPLAAGILYPFIGYQFDPMVAGIAMALSSVSVVSNSLRLKHISI
jgi:Cu2+-exporting ATPase